MSKKREYRKAFRMNTETLEYDFQLRKRRPWWLLFLLLLPLLLLLRCNRDIDVLVEDCGGKVVSNATVKMEYEEFALCSNGQFHYRNSVSRVETTDTTGVAVFEKCSVTLYDFIFHNRKSIELEAAKGTAHGYAAYKFHHKRHPYEVQITDMWVNVRDLETDDDIPGAKVVCRLADGNEVSATTSSDGKAPLCGLPCDIDKLTIIASAEGYADTIVDVVAIDSVCADAPFVIKLRPINVGYTCDIVMCFDNTGSMSGVLSIVKENILDFPSQLSDYCNRHNKKIKTFRIKVIDFGDFLDKEHPNPMHVSDFFVLPGHEKQLKNAVDAIKMTYGEDEPEDALEAIATAFRSDWGGGGTRRRQIIIVYTDANAHDLGTTKAGRNYPDGMPSSFEQLTAEWNAFDSRTKRLVLYAIEDNHRPWDRITSEWDCVTRKTTPLREVFTSSAYEEVLRDICESM